MLNHKIYVTKTKIKTVFLLQQFSVPLMQLIMSVQYPKLFNTYENIFQNTCASFIQLSNISYRKQTKVTYSRP